MGIEALLAVATIAAGVGHGKPAVRVCMISSDRGALYAQSIASKMFDEIGVAVRWLRDARACRSESAPITVTLALPRLQYPGAMARALAYEGTRIEVFYDRVRKQVGPRRLPAVLGHVLAHELAHVLQGLTDHTDTGIMKARWDGVDFDQMVWKPFSFTRHDAQLIHMGLQNRRSSQTTAAR